MPVFMPSRGYRDSAADWRLLRDCDIGERAIKDAGELYLPKLTDQDNEEYGHYLSRAQFPGILRRTVDDFVAMVLHRDIEVQLGANEDLREELETITFEGDSFYSFAAKALREVLLIGRYGALVDAPPSGGRVYIAGYPAESILNVRATVMGGIKQATVIVLEEIIEHWEDQFTSQDRRIYRTLELGQGDYDTSYQQTLYNPDGNGQYPDSPSEIITPTIRGVAIPRLPFTFFGAKNTTWEIQRSPMLDIAQHNLHLYRFLADLNWGLHFTALPTPVISGAVSSSPDQERAALAIGPSRVWELDAESTATMLEFTGSGLTFLENAVRNTMDIMRVLGARMISTGAQGSENPQVAQLREQGERSTLFQVVESTEKGLTDTLKRWVRFKGRSDEGVSCIMSRDFRNAPMDENMAVALTRMYRSGNLPQEVVDQAMVEGGFFPTRVTAADLKRLRSQPGQLPEIPADKL